jgi:hypothetical protein
MIEAGLATAMTIAALGAVAERTPLGSVLSTAASSSGSSPRKSRSPSTRCVSPASSFHVRNLSDEQARQAAGLSRWLDQQGFYVYRRGRLTSPVTGSASGTSARRTSISWPACLPVDVPAELIQPPSLPRCPDNLTGAALTLADVTF